MTFSVSLKRGWRIKGCLKGYYVSDPLQISSLILTKAAKCVLNVAKDKD